MTKKEFEQKFNDIYITTLKSSFDSTTVKTRLKNIANESGKISSEDLYPELLLLSAEFSKQLTYNLLSSVLEFSDSNN